MATVKGFMVRLEQAEVLFALRADGLVLQSDEHPLDNDFFNRASRQWSITAELPQNAVFIGTYRDPLIHQIPRPPVTCDLTQSEYRGEEDCRGSARDQGFI